MPSDTTAPAAPNTDLALLISRILLVALFPISGTVKLMNPTGTAAYLGSLGAPMPEIAVWVAIAAELILPVLVLLGVFTRWAALGLILYTIGTIFIGHRFWEFSGPQFNGQLFSFMKNWALCGGLGLLAWFGPGRYAISPKP